MAKLTPAQKAKRESERKAKLAEERRLRGLTGSELNRFLFGSETRPEREEWKQKRSKQPVDLDKEMEPLEGAHRRKRFRSDLPAGFCPYYDVRCFLSELVHHINVGLSMVDSEREVPARQMLNGKHALLKLAKRIRGIGSLPADGLIHIPRAGDLFGQTVSLRLLMEDRAEVFALTERILAAGEDIERLALMFGKQRERLLPAANPGDVWFLAFVYWMGCYFRYLTGENPGPDVEIFVKIVDEAYVTLGGAGFSLRSHVKTVRDRKIWNFESDDFSRPILGFGRFDVRRGLRATSPAP